MWKWADMELCGENMRIRAVFSTKSRQWQNELIHCNTFIVLNDGLWIIYVEKLNPVALWWLEIETDPKIEQFSLRGQIFRNIYCVC